MNHKLTLHDFQLISIFFTSINQSFIIYIYIYIAALRYPTQAPAVSKCPSGYTATADSCFSVVKTAMDFKHAQTTCQLDGANLASINSKYEQMSIEVLAKDVPGAVWIGLKREVYVYRV